MQEHAHGHMSFVDMQEHAREAQSEVDECESEAVFGPPRRVAEMREEEPFFYTHRLARDTRWKKRLPRAEQRRSPKGQYTER